MGVFTDLIKQMLKDNNIDDERTLRALEDEGASLAEEFAENYERIQETKKKFVEQVDVSPVDFEKFERDNKEKTSDKEPEKESSELQEK